MNAKLQEIIFDHGIEGYGLYWYCLELVAQNVTSDNLTFELEHDARIIGRNIGMPANRVEEIMKAFIANDLFSASEGRIQCLKLANRCDDFTAKAVRRSGVKSIEKQEVRQSPTKSDKVHLEKEDRSKNIEIEDNKPFVQAEPKRSKFKYNDEQMRFASWFYDRVKLVAPSTKEPNLKSWANTARLMNEQDGISLRDMAEVFNWANTDDFWNTNILSPDKLRKQYSKLEAKMNSRISSGGSKSDIMRESEESDWHKQDLGL